MIEYIKIDKREMKFDIWCLVKSVIEMETTKQMLHT